MKKRSESKKFRQLQTELQLLIQKEFHRLYGAKTSVPSGAEIQIELQFCDSPENQVTMSTPLIEQVRTQLRDLNIQTGAYAPGKVYCYLHESLECHHCTPETPSQVMSGYQANGVPEWDELLDVLIDEAPSTAADMYADRQQLTAIFMRGRDLKRRLLPGFGRASRTYNILCQVVAGFLHYRPDVSSREILDTIALTLQAIEYRGADGRIQLALNVITGVDEPNILDCLVDGPFDTIRKAILNARRQLKELQDRLNATSSHRQPTIKRELMPKIPSILQGIRAEFIRYNKQRSHRTKHAANRIQQQRPVFKAVADALKADSSDILEDRIHRTFLVPGKRYRWHVFNRDGQLVTSLYLSGEQVTHRRLRKRWNPPSDERLQQFLTTLNTVYGEDDTETKQKKH